MGGLALFFKSLQVGSSYSALISLTMKIRRVVRFVHIQEHSLCFLFFFGFLWGAKED